MSYPSEAISLHRANAIVFELMELGLDPEFDTAMPSDKIRGIMDVLRVFGASCSTSVRTHEGSPGSTPLLRYVRINMHTIHCAMDDLLGDWDARYTITGVDTVDLWNRGSAVRGCQ